MLIDAKKTLNAGISPSSQKRDGITKRKVGLTLKDYTVKYLSETRFADSTLDMKRAIVDSVTISETLLKNKPSVTAKQTTKGVIDAFMSLPNVKVISSSVEKSNPVGLDSARGYTVFNKGGIFIYYDGINANIYDENKMIQVSFIGTAKEENEVKEMQNCVTEIINTIQYIK